MTHAILGYDHVAITTPDVERSTAFYREMLGAVVVQDHARKVSCWSDPSASAGRR